MSNSHTPPIELPDLKDGTEAAVRDGLWGHRDSIAKALNCDMILDIDVSDEGRRFVFVDFKDRHEIEWQQRFVLSPIPTGGNALVSVGDPIPLDEELRASLKRVGARAREAAFAAGRPVVVLRGGSLVEEFPDGTTRTIESLNAKENGDRK
jgi:hypothetical protein